MATTSNTYTGNGTNKLFSITFPYLATSDINVYLNGTLQTITTQYTFANATTVEFVTAPANGAVILLDRSTDDSTLQATFFPGSSIKANDLNFNFDQVLYLSQETANSAANQSTAGLQTQITAATNTANAAVVTANTANSTANTANATANGIAGTANTALTTANAAEATANAIAGTANTALSTANAAVVTANAAVVTANAAARIVSGTAIATTSGTSINFTSIPSWVKRITLSMVGVSTNGSSLMIVRLGDSGGVETTGYNGASALVYGAGSLYSSVAHSSGFTLTGQATGASSVDLYGALIFTLAESSSNTWTCNGNLSRTDFPVGSFISGGKALSATLDRISITTVNGTDTFDAGMVNIIYEG